MNRINFKIPEKYKKRNIYIFAGLEPIARFRRGYRILGV
jgi:hypothetical protein